MASSSESEAGWAGEETDSSDGDLEGFPPWAWWIAKQMEAEESRSEHALAACNRPVLRSYSRRPLPDLPQDVYLHIMDLSESCR